MVLRVGRGSQRCYNKREERYSMMIALAIAGLIVSLHALREITQETIVSRHGDLKDE